MLHVSSIVICQFMTGSVTHSKFYIKCISKFLSKFQVTCIQDGITTDTLPCTPWKNQDKFPPSNDARHEYNGSSSPQKGSVCFCFLLRGEENFEETDLTQLWEAEKDGEISIYKRFLKYAMLRVCPISTMEQNESKSFEF